MNDLDSSIPTKNIKVDLIRIFGVAYYPQVDRALEIICSRLMGELEMLDPLHEEGKEVLEEVLNLIVKFFTERES